MTKTITLKTLFIPILAISLIGTLGISNVYAQQSMGSCTGDCSAPTIGLDHNHKQLVEGGVTINGKAIDITGFTQIIPTQTTSTGKTVNVALKIYEDSSVGGYLEHASLTIGDSSMVWKRKLDKTETTTVDDKSNILQNVSIKTNKLNPLLTEVNFSFQFTKPMESKAMKISVWDSIRNVNNYYLNEAFSVTGKSLSMSKPMTTMSDGSMNDDGPCNLGTVYVMHSITGLTSCILKHHVSIWNSYGWTT
jgi:hypothetical protein